MEQLNQILQLKNDGIGIRDIAQLTTLLAGSFNIFWNRGSIVLAKSAKRTARNLVALSIPYISQEIDFLPSTFPLSSAVQKPFFQFT